MLLGYFLFSITKNPPKIVTKLLHKAQKHMNAKDAVLAKEMKGKGRETEEQAVIVIRRRRHEVLDKPQGKRRSFHTGNLSSLTSLL